MSRDTEMGLIDHLDELRGRIIYALIAVVSVGIVAYVFKDALLQLLTIPLADYYQVAQDQVPGIVEAWRAFLAQSGQFDPDQVNAVGNLFERLLRQQSGLMFIHPTEAFLSYIKLSLYTGLLVGSPVVLFQVWRFIMPALYDNERRYFLSAFTFGSGLFYVGVAFSFFLVFPFVVRFLINLGSDFLYANFTIGNYISFSMMFLLVFGLVFELPVLIFMAVRLGLTTVEFLRQKRRYIYVICFAGAAVITPPDVFSQVAVGVPVVVLFESSLLLARWAERKREREVAEAEAAPADDAADEDGAQ